jgi:hypothetical protein
MSNDNDSPNSSVYVEESDFSNNTDETSSTTNRRSKHRIRSKKKTIPDKKPNKAKKSVIADNSSKYTFVGHIKVFNSNQQKFQI